MALLGLLTATGLRAQPQAGEAATPAGSAWDLPAVVISGSREAQRVFDLPAVIQSVDEETIRSAGSQVNLSEALSRIPGVAALNRQNYAQDLQLSIRGFGARSSFGIRGVRLIVDGIPATMPDGQAQAATVSLPSTARLEVLRGPLALLHGNAAGGVVQAFSREPQGEPQAELGVSLGDFGAQRIGLGASGSVGRLGVRVDWSRFQTDGYREHSAARREQFNAILRLPTEPGTRLTLVANVFDQPLSQDPLGLTRAQVQADPRQADAAALSQDTRKTVAQNQVGLLLAHRLTDSLRVDARLHVGQRAVFQTLATPVSAQTAPSAAGGVVDLDRDFSGIGLQLTQTMRMGPVRASFTLGVDHDRQREWRRGYLNERGVVGALKRDELNAVRNTDLYALMQWRLPDDWLLLAGLRDSRVDFHSQDRYIVPGNGDDSGRRVYRASSPVLGLSRSIGESLRLHASVGKGFETPTFAELAYRATSGSLTGLNLGLEASRSRQSEIGAKWRSAGGHHRLDLALFSIRTEDEIVVDASLGGRTTYRNAGRSQRDGAELAWQGRLAPTLSARMALSWLSARYLDAFTTGTGASAVTVPAGNRLPGAANRLAFAELAWRPGTTRVGDGLELALEAIRVGSLPVNDANTDAAEAHALVNLRLGFSWGSGRVRIAPFLRIENLADRPYIGSVIVNEANRRFFEPAPGRTWLAGVRLEAAI